MTDTNKYIELVPSTNQTEPKNLITEVSYSNDAYIETNISPTQEDNIIVTGDSDIEITHSINSSEGGKNEKKKTKQRICCSYFNIAARYIFSIIFLVYLVQATITLATSWFDKNSIIFYFYICGFMYVVANLYTRKFHVSIDVCLPGAMGMYLIICTVIMIFVDTLSSYVDSKIHCYMARDEFIIFCIYVGLIYYLGICYASHYMHICVKKDATDKSPDCATEINSISILNTIHALVSMAFLGYMSYLFIDNVFTAESIIERPSYPDCAIMRFLHPINFKYLIICAIGMGAVSATMVNLQDSRNPKISDMRTWFSRIIGYMGLVIIGSFTAINIYLVWYSNLSSVLVTIAIYLQIMTPAIIIVN